MAFGIALVGLHHWYTAFGVVDNVNAAENASLIGLAELRPERLAQAQERFKDHTVTGNADELIHDPAVNLVALCCSTAQAPELATRALRAGKHVLSVKPPARTLAEMEAPLLAAKETGNFYGSFECLQRLSPRAQILRELIQTGVIGTPMAYYQIGHGGLPSPWPGETGSSWWTDAAQVPGGAWIDHSIYSVDLARFVFGGEIVSANGIIENRVTPGLALEDYGISLMRLKPDNGSPSVSLIFEDTWSAKPGFGVHRNEIIGTEGRITGEGNEWVVSKPGNDVSRHVIPDGPFFNVGPFVTALETGTSLPFGSSDARANLAACLEVYNSTTHH